MKVKLDCFEINKTFWKILGIYPWKKDNLCVFIYSNMFVCIFIFGYDILYTVDLFYMPRKMDIFVEQLMLYLTAVVVSSKVLIFKFMKNKIIKLLTILESDLFKADNETERQILYEADQLNIKGWKIYAITSYVCNLTHVTFPFINHLFFSVKLDPPVCGYDFLSENTTQRFIYPIYLYQSIGIHFHMTNNVYIDTFIVGLMIFLIAQLDILQVKMKNVTNVPFLPKGAGDEHFRLKTKNIADDCILSLNKALEHYDDVTKFCYLIEEVFSLAIFSQFTISSGIICVCLYRFTLPAPWQYYIFLTSYIALMIVQILIPCWFGTKIMEKSTLISQAVYECDWIPQSRRFKSSMRLFMERAKRPLSITGWKMFPLSLSTFTSIMNTAYSFFTLLRNVQARESENNTQ